MKGNAKVRRLRHEVNRSLLTLVDSCASANVVNDALDVDDTHDRDSASSLLTLTRPIETCVRYTVCC